MKIRSVLFKSALVFGLTLASASHATTTVSYYGDDDGFGVGQTSGVLSAPNTSNAGLGEAPGTDVRLIGADFIAPAFAPTGSFGAFSLTGPITSATLTLRLGSFNPLNPVNGPNVLVLDGLTVNPAFLASFTPSVADQIVTQSIALDSSFFAALSDGNVSLAGTRISEGNGFGSFQVDFLRLDIVTSGVSAAPEPATWAMMIGGFGMAGASLRRRKAKVAVTYA